MEGKPPSTEGEGQFPYSRPGDHPNGKCTSILENRYLLATLR